MNIDRHFRRENFRRYALKCRLLLNEWDLITLAVVLTGVVALSLIKRLVLPVLMDLV